MILYSVNYKGAFSNYEWSIVTIWKTKESAEASLKRYEQNWDLTGPEDPEFCIMKIDTDINGDCIYDCEYI